MKNCFNGLNDSIFVILCFFVRIFYCYRFLGFKEVRLVLGRLDIVFVEFENEL